MFLVNYFRSDDSYQQNLNYLTGDKSGKSLIGSEEKALASKGQSHGIANNLSSIVKGPIDALKSSIVSVAGYALYDGAFENVFGTDAQAKLECTKNIAKNIFVWNPLETLRNIGNVEIDKVQNIISNPLLCRLSNLGYAMADVVQAHPYITVAGVVVATALFTLNAKSSYEHKEAEAKDKLSKGLADKFKNFAEKLVSDFDNADEAKKEELLNTAHKILLNKDNIVKELSDLGVLKNKKIEQIVAPLMSIAQKLEDSFTG